MPCMAKRQANTALVGATALLFLLISCTAETPISAPAQMVRPAPSPTASTPVLAEPSPTPDPCFGARGQVEDVAFDSPWLPSFYIYLPECYANASETHYPVLYLLHGQGYEADQWLRLGIVELAEKLIADGEIPPFLIVMPFNAKSSRSVDVDAFGDILVNELIPFVDKNYRTVAAPPNRALGGLSRGGGWTIRYGLTRPDLFGAFGAHSPAIFYNDYNKLDDWLAEIPADEMPLIYLDIGDGDSDTADARYFADVLADADVLHEWHLFTGLHDENYWQAHVEEYLRWYGAFFDGGN